MAHAEAYNDPGTPEEQTRRTFMANAVIALGGVIGIGLVIPLLTSLVPPASETSDQWSPLTPEEAASLQKATDTTPVKVIFKLHETNGYFGATDSDEFIWAVKATDAQPRRRAASASCSGEASSDRRSTSFDLLMSQFWQKRQARLQPAVPNERMLEPG